MSDETCEKRSAEAKGIAVDWCMAGGCKVRAYFGFKGRYGVEWFCSDHKADGEKLIK